jgi:hypothetical protein
MTFGMFGSIFLLAQFFQVVFVLAGAGMGLFFAPIANVVLSAVRPEEEGKASGANNATASSAAPSASRSSLQSFRPTART